jgi:hypothetical protein
MRRRESLRVSEPPWSDAARALLATERELRMAVPSDVDCSALASLSARPRANLETMAGAEVTIPVALPSAALAHEPAPAIERRLRLLWALDEIRAGRTTRVRAAAWLSLPLDDFLALADAHGLAAFDYDPDDFKSELASLK